MAGAAEIARALEDEDEHLLGGHHRFVEVDLPVHDPPAGEEAFDGVDAFLLDDQAVVGHVEHLDDAVVADDAFADAGEVAVAVEVVHPVHIELAGDQLVEEVFFVFAFEDADGEVEPALEFVVEALHEVERKFFVVGFDQGVFQGVGEGAVSDVVEQDGNFDGFGFAFIDLDALAFEAVDGFAHQVQRA